MSDILTIGRNESTKALSDEKFLSEFPMFRVIRSKADVLEKSAGSGCSSCRKRRIAQNLLLDFLNVLKTLPEDQVAGVKRYFGAEKLSYTMFDREKGIYRPVIV